MDCDNHAVCVFPQFNFFRIRPIFPEILYDRHVAEGHFVIPVSFTQSVTPTAKAQLVSWEQRRRHLRHGLEMMRDNRAWKNMKLLCAECKIIWINLFRLRFKGDN
jgi:hypothetical protein